jgi:hypothetical protein
MKRVALVAAVVGTTVLAGGLLNVTPALGAPPTIEHFRDVGTDVDPDYCGTGQTVDIAFDIRGTDWTSADGELFRSTAHGAVVFTNPANGRSVTNSFAGQLTDIITSGDPEGVHTDLITQKGLPEKLKLPHGRVLLRDAGIIAFAITFDGDEFISQEIVLIKGPHPEADSDFELFCEITTEALGIS